MKNVSVAVILGSGLGARFGRLEDETTIPYDQIKGMPVSRVPGHPGVAGIGRIGKKSVAVFKGRVHYYEGWDMSLVAAPARVAREMGAEVLIVTNAAGGIQPRWRAGEFMLITDHINLIGANPLRGTAMEFPDLSNAYDPGLRKIALSCARRLRIRLHQGVYAAMPGPSFETPAEIRMLRRVGADVVGMSTVPEVIQAVSLGMRVCGLSCITNRAAGLAKDRLSHHEVIDITQRVGGRFVELIREIVRAL